MSTAETWTKLLGESSSLWKRARLKAFFSRRSILLPTGIGGMGAFTFMESLLGVALTLRGCRVRFLLCDHALPACLRVHLGKLKDPEIITERRMKTEICPQCFSRGENVYLRTGLPILRYGNFLRAEERDWAVKEASLVDPRSGKNGENVDFEHALAGTLRFFARGTLEWSPYELDVFRRYYEASLLSRIVIKRCLQKYRPKTVCFHHGIYIPQGIIGDECRKENAHVVNWQVAYRKSCFIFSHHDTYHRTLMDESPDVWEGIEWNDALQDATMSYLEARRHGREDWIWFHNEPNEDIDKLRQELGIDPDKPLISALTNVFWDAQLHYRANAFPNMLSWLQDTIEYFKTRPDLQLAVRIHPAEVRGGIPSRQPLTEEIRKAFPELPSNIIIVPPDNESSTYALAEASNAVIIYGTKTGVELAARGIPVIVAGEAWIRNKGLTRDIANREDYLNALGELPYANRMTDAEVLRARKYAFHFFFRRFMPLSFVHPSKNPKEPFTLEIESLEDLLPGKNLCLDRICEAIMDEKAPFIYEAERDPLLVPSRESQAFMK
jgi:hypothetical protein